MDNLQETYSSLTQQIAEEHRKVFELLDMNELQQILDVIEKAENVFLYAAGREGISLRSFAMRLAHMGKRAYWLFDDTTVGIKPGDLFIMTIGAGRVGSFEYLLNKVHEAGGKILLFTANPDGEQVVRYADYKLFIHSTPYLLTRDDLVPTVQMMGNQYEQHLYMMCDVIIMLLVKQMGLTFDDLEARHRNVE